MSAQSTPLVRPAPPPFIVWEDVRVWRDGTPYLHACPRGWSAKRGMGRMLLEKLEEEHPDGLYTLGDAEAWGAELEDVSARLAIQARKVPMSCVDIGAIRHMLEERHGACEACNIAALVAAARWRARRAS